MNLYIQVLAGSAVYRVYTVRSVMEVLEQEYRISKRTSAYFVFWRHSDRGMIDELVNRQSPYQYQRNQETYHRLLHPPPATSPEKGSSVWDLFEWSQPCCFSKDCSAH